MGQIAAAGASLETRQSNIEQRRTPPQDGAFGRTMAELRSSGQAEAPEKKALSYADQMAGIFAPVFRNVQSAAGPEGVSLESMLKAKYPRLAYHVFDASSSYWRTRNDYPHYLLYQSGDKAKETLANWRPNGANPFYGSVDGRFIAPKEIRALSNIPPGSKAVVIHPKAQERMENDPEFAAEIMARIEGWWAFDVARNEAIMPGSTAMMSQSIAIGEDGSIVNAQASSPGRLTTSGSDEDAEKDKPDFWELRLARHARMMKRWRQEQIEHSMEVSREFSAYAARQRMLEMLHDGALADVLGDSVAGIPTAQVFSSALLELSLGLL